MAWELLRSCCRPFPQRFVVASMVLLGISVQYVNRMSFDLILTVITHKVFEADKEFKNDCQFNETILFFNRSMNAELFLMPEEEANVLGGFYIGYIISQLPGGVLADLTGPKGVMGVGIFISGVCSLLTPLCARLSETTWALMINRIIMGLAHGPLLPSISAFIARRSIPSERTVLSSYVTMGISVGAILSSAITQFLIYYLESWDTIFYIYGGLTILYSMVWHVFIHDTPTKHPYISDEERVKISNELNTENTPIDFSMSVILKSVPVSAMIMGYVGYILIFYFLVILIPKYMDNVLDFYIMDYHLLRCGTYVILSISSISSAGLAKFILRRGWLSKTNQCKVWVVLSNLVSGALLLVGIFAGCDRLVAVSCFITSFAFTGFIFSSIWVMNVDLAPDYAGRLMGLMNGSASILGILVPHVVWVVMGPRTLESWQREFLVTFVIACLVTVFFVIFGSSEPIRGSSEGREPLPGPSNLPN